MSSSGMGKIEIFALSIQGENGWDIWSRMTKQSLDYLIEVLFKPKKTCFSIF